MRRGQTLAQVIAERYRTLCAMAVGPADAERQAFAEVLARDAPTAADLTTLYDEFLRLTKPAAVRQHGIYSTPGPVVQAQVQLVDDLLRTRLDCADAFGDPRVRIIDPAVGVGTYPLAILQHVGGEAADVVRQRMLLLEAMPGAAVIGRACGLLVRECDALQTQLTLDAPIIVCIGNPPYRRRQSDRAAREALDGFGFVSTAGGVHRKNLYNDYVYFWRWALSTVLEQRSGPGIICFVTAGSYVHGPAFGGMRQSMRRLVDELWVLDLEGDHLAARASQNVFPIRTPVAIALAVRYGVRPRGAPWVHYARLGGTAEDKCVALQEMHKIADVEWLPAPAEGGEPLRHSPRSSFFTWPALTDLFPWQTSGAQLKRTWPIGVAPEVLRARWQRLLALPLHERAVAFGPTRDRRVDSAPPDLLQAGWRLRPLSELPPDAACVEPVRYAYRAFDRQWVLPDARLGDFPRPALWKVSGPRQIFLTTMLTNVLGSGPAAVATALVPDLDHFRGSFGARGVIPLWCNDEASQPNVSIALLGRLSDQYGLEVDAPALMAYCYALLNAPAYTRRFEAELRTPGPRVPFTGDAAIFARGVSLGEALIGQHTYAHVQAGEANESRPIGPRYPTSFHYDPDSAALVVGEGRVGPVCQAAWDYRVSGYPVLAGWLRQRISKRGRSLLDAIQPTSWTPDLSRELLELIWLLEATLITQPSLDELLEEAISGSSL